MQHDGQARLEFIQNLSYKFVELLTCNFGRSPDELVRQQITYRYNALKSRLAMDDCLLRGVINSSETAKHSEWLALHTTLSSGPVAPLRHLVERPENAVWRKHLTSYVTAGKKLNEIDT